MITLHEAERIRIYNILRLTKLVRELLAKHLHQLLLTDRTTVGQLEFVPVPLLTYIQALEFDTGIIR